LADLNATQAAIRSGYSAKNADKIGPELLGKTRVAQAVAKAMQTRSERTKITTDQVLKEFSRIGLSDMRDFVSWGPDGVKVKESGELTEDQARAVAEVSETKGDKGGAIKLKLHDKQAALVNCGRHLGMFAERLDINANVTFNLNFGPPADDCLEAEVVEVRGLITNERK
jgi:phage terminase small subunit